jgi:PEP-CTERM motif-containing protein
VVLALSCCLLWAHSSLPLPLLCYHDGSAIDKAAVSGFECEGFEIFRHQPKPDGFLEKESSVTSEAFAHFVLVTLVLGLGVSTVNADPIPIRILTFDQLQAQAEPAIPNGYGGLSWSNFNVLNFDNLATSVSANSGYLHGRITPPNVVYNSDGAVASFEAQTPFNFVSAFLTSAWRNDLHLTVQGFADGQLKYSKAAILHTTTDANFEAFNFLNVDRVRFESFGGINAVGGGDGTHFAVDNLTVAAAAPTPEPASLLLLATGVVAAALRRRHR